MQLFLSDTFCTQNKKSISSMQKTVHISTNKIAKFLFPSYPISWFRNFVSRLSLFLAHTQFVKNSIPECLRFKRKQFKRKQSKSKQSKRKQSKRKQSKRKQSTN